MGTRSAQPAPEEGTQTPHRQVAEQVRRRLTRGAGTASDFRARRVSRDASTFRGWFKRGGEFAPRTSTSACSRPLSRIRGSVSSCHAITRPLSNETDSSVGFASWRGSACCPRCVSARRWIWQFEPSARRTPHEWKRWRPTSRRSFAGSRLPRPLSRRARSADAARSGPVRARLPGGDLTDTARFVPLLSKLLGLRDRSDRTLRRDARRVDGGAADCPVSSVPTRRLRPRSIAIRPSEAIRPPETLHG